MSERLDRIESILEIVAQQQRTTAVQQQRTAEQQQRNTEDIDTLLGAVSTTEVGLRSLSEEVRLVSEEVQSLAQSIAENQRRFEILRAEAMADRQRFDERFERVWLEIQEMKLESQAQREVTRSLLAELTSTNRRVDNLEQAS